MRKNTLLSFITIFILFLGQTAFAQTPVPMASQPSLTYTENFADITNWTNNFAAGIGANRWLGFAANATGTIPDGVRTTASTLIFQGTSTSGGVQRGGLAGSNNPAGTIVLLSTGSPQNTTAAAIEVFLDFTGTTAGKIGFDWTRVNNSTGDRVGSLRIYTSTDGVVYTELSGAAVNDLVNNGGTASGSISNVQLPASLDNSATARVRFYYFNGSLNGSSGSRPKVSIDNLSITATVSGAPALTGNTAGFTGTFGGVVVGNSSSSSSYTIAGANLTNDIIVTPPAGFEIRTGANPFSTSNITLTQTGGTVNTTTIDVRFTPTGTGPFSGNVVNSSVGASDVNVAVSGNGLSTQPTVQASNVTFASVTSSAFTINFNSGDGTNRLVLIKSGSAVDSDPIDGTSYTASATFGSGTQIGTGNYVVYNGTGTSIAVTGLNGATTYHVAVYEFNGSAGSENYNITSPATNSQATLTPTISVVINKYQNSTPDGIELLVVQNNTDMRGMIIKDFSASMGGDGGGKFQFTTNTLWSSVPSGTLIILRNNATAADSVATDYTLDLGLSNTSFFTNLGGTFDISTTEMVMIKYAGSDPAGVNGSMHVLAGGTAGALFTSAPTPKLISTGTSGTNFFVYANNTNSVIGDYNGTDATGGATGLVFGTPNNSTNQTFINSLRTTDIEFTGNGSLPAGTYGTITINGSGAVVTLTGNVTANTLVLTDGILELGANNLIVNSTIGGGGATYVRTNGIGRLTINNIGNSNVVFPIGLNTYNQFSITNNGTVDNFSVNVQNTIDNPTPDNTQAVQLQWNITEEVAGGSDAILSFRWTDAEEGLNVNHIILAVGHYTGGSYTGITCDPVVELTPTIFLVTTSVGVTSFSPFILGNQNVMPVELASFTSSVNGNNVKLNWSTVSEENNSGFDIERKNVTGEWAKISNIAGNGTSNTAHSYSFEDKNLTSGKYNYRLKQIDFNGNYKYYQLSNEVIVGTPTKYALSQNYPNPFNPSTSINYELPKDNFVTLKIYDMMGREVASLVNNNQLAGFYTVKFDASKLSSGIYFYKLQANDFTATKKLMLVK